MIKDGQDTLERKRNYVTDETVRRGMIKLLQGDCLDIMKTLPDNSIDAVLTDPPYTREMAIVVCGVGVNTPVTPHCVLTTSSPGLATPK